MIVSHRHRFIFLKTRKTAGTSLEIALSRFCGVNDVITPISPEDERLRRSLGYRGPQNTLVPLSKYAIRDWVRSATQGTRARYFNHIGATQLRRLVGDHCWVDYFKFCFERNPYDKLESMYGFLRGTGRVDCDFPAFIRRRESGWSDFPRISIGGRVAVDRVYRYEELGEALPDLQSRIGLAEPIDMSRIRAKAGFRRADAPHSYSPEECGIVQTIFAREIQSFGYSPWPPAASRPSEG